MPAQTSYPFDQPQGQAGLLYDIGFTDKVSRQAEGAVGFGRAVQLGTDPEKQVAESTDAFFGVSILDHAREQALDGSVQYDDEEAVSILRRGRIWVQVNDAVVAGATAYVDTDNVDADLKANFTDTVGTNVATGGIFVTATDGSGLAVLEINRP